MIYKFSRKKEINYYFVDLKACQEAEADETEDEEMMTESDNEINVGNESLTTRVTKEKQKRINKEKTVIIEEKYEITSKPECIEGEFFF